jgi:large subunit ribosomal protein L32e
VTDVPTPAAIRKARKAELVAWCEAFGLDAEGKVDELRARLLTHVESAAEREAEPAPEAPAKAAPEAEALPEEEEAEAEKEEEAPKARKKAKAEEEPPYAPKLKPQLTAEVRALLRVRREVAGRRPRFLRQEWFTKARLGMKWRKPMGQHTKLRRHYGYRPNVVSIGYRGPKMVRGLHPSGFREVLIHTVRDLDAIDPRVEAARIAGTVGGRRRTEIQAAADEKGIRVLNRRGEE